MSSSVLDLATGPRVQGQELAPGCKQVHGDCNVPAQWKDDPKLGSWCSTQRKAYKNNELSPDRIRRLKDLSFRFVLLESKKK